MIQMPSVRPVPWATTSGGVQAVSAARSVQPLGAGPHHTTDPAAREQSDSPVGTASTASPGQAVQTGPLGQAVQTDQAATRRVTGGTNAQPLDLARERELQREQARQIEEQADRDREAMDRLRQVLTNVWEASAAVVEQALRENADSSLASGGSLDQGGLSAMHRSRRPIVFTPQLPGQANPHDAGISMPNGPWTSEGILDATDTGAAVALIGYDERGQGNPERPGVGQIISQRV